MLKSLLALGFSGSLHYYVWWRHVRTARLPRRALIAASCAMLALWLSIPITTTARLWAPTLGSTLAWVSMPWFALVGLMVVLTLAIDIPRILSGLTRRVLRRLTGSGS